MSSYKSIIVPTLKSNLTIKRRVAKLFWGKWAQAVLEIRTSDPAQLKYFDLNAHEGHLNVTKFGAGGEMGGAEAFRWINDELEDIFNTTMKREPYLATMNKRVMSLDARGKCEKGTVKSALKLLFLSALKRFIENLVDKVTEALSKSILSASYERNSDDQQGMKLSADVWDVTDCKPEYKSEVVRVVDKKSLDDCLGIKED